MRRALISVSDKSEIVDFARALNELNFEIISTGGTYKLLKDQGVKVIQIDEVTDFPEILGGRVKTLHPKIHGGLLALRDNQKHIQEVEDFEIKYIDLVCVNLYPFKETIANPESSFDEAIEQIDIGGPSMLRSAAKNYRFVTVVSDISDYQKVIAEIKEYGDTLATTKRTLSAKAFARTAQYDAYISNYLNKELKIKFPKTLTLTYDFHQELRYGENPHQEAALYQSNNNPYSLLQASILNGKPLSYNNIQDANAAINILKEHQAATAVALKHMNPCGVASAENILEAYQKAYLSDTVSIFGGIVALNRPVDVELAQELNKIFLEIVIAPAYTEAALTVLRKKKNLRVLQLDTEANNLPELMTVKVNGGLLLQDSDNYLVDITELQSVTKSKANDLEKKDLLFAWKVVKHVKSNAIVITYKKQTVGIGAGQMNRVGAAEIALEQAKNNGYNKELILASDAFFPFDDVVKLAAKYGVSAIIQPGGSIRDQDSIDACDDLGIKMVFTGNRHFKH